MTVEYLIFCFVSLGIDPKTLLDIIESKSGKRSCMKLRKLEKLDEHLITQFMDLMANADTTITFQLCKQIDIIFNYSDLSFISPSFTPVSNDEGHKIICSKPFGKI